MRKIIFLLIIFFSFFINIWYWYFENKYYCDIQDSKIIVSLKSMNDADKICMEKIKDISDKIKEIDYDVLRAEKYIHKKEDLEYRTQVQNQLISNRDTLASFREDMLNAIDIFEANLFQKFIKALSFYLNKERVNVVSWLNDINTKLELLKADWDIPWFKEQLKEYDAMYVKLTLLDKILLAKNFDDLAPFLRYWLEFYIK